MVGADISEADGLAPNDNPSIWGARLAAATSDVMLVGHLPHLERLAGLLVNGDAAQPVVGFPAGGLVVVERQEGGWRVAATRS
jgi:phosphohistidine phosphatase